MTNSISIDKLLRIGKAVLVATVVAVCNFPDKASAELIVFEFAVTGGAANATGNALDGLSSGTHQVNGTTVNVTIDATANDGVFNLTTSSPNFGINAAGPGDDTDAFDDGSGVTEVMTFFFTGSAGATFNFVSIDFDRLDGAGQPGDDIGTLSFAGGNAFTFDNSNTNGSDLLTVNESFTAGQLITLSHVDGNGFGIESITLDVQLAAIPEPASIVLFGSAVAWFFGKRRRQK